MADHRLIRRLGLLGEDRYFVRVGRLWICDFIYSYDMKPSDSFQVWFSTDKRAAKSLPINNVIDLNRYFDVAAYEVNYRELSMDDLGDKIKQYKKGKKHE